jgi:hypothetical protein
MRPKVVTETGRHLAADLGEMFLSETHVARKGSEHRHRPTRLHRHQPKMVSWMNSETRKFLGSDAAVRSNDNLKCGRDHGCQITTRAQTGRPRAAWYIDEGW